MTSNYLKFRVDAVVEPDGDGFHAYCPALKGLHTCGDKEEDALSNARDATIAYLQSSIKHGDPIPVGQVGSLAPLRGGSTWVIELETCLRRTD